VSHVFHSSFACDVLASPTKIGVANLPTHEVTDVALQ
jgi:hypothetical protein